MEGFKGLGFGQVIERVPFMGSEGEFSFGLSGKG